MKNIPVITFIHRTWLLIVASLTCNWLMLTQIKFNILGSWQFDEMRGGYWEPQTPYEHFGGLGVFVNLALIAFVLSPFCIHLFYRQTIDQDTHDGTYLKNWQECDAKTKVWVSNMVRVITFLGLCILGASIARGGEPIPVNQVARWNAAQVNPKDRIAVDLTINLYERSKARYQVIQAMRKNGVPAPILFCLHMRESDNNFRRHAHEGSPLTHRTRDEPKGRLPHPEPPYTFEQSAEDAYYVCEHPPLDRIDWTNMQAALDKMESFNGYGYRAKGIPAPYLYSGTSLYKSGKYVADHVFDRNAVDKQLGCVAILKRMQERGVAISFASYDTKAK